MESGYHAFALCGHEIYPETANFDQFFREHLVNMMDPRQHKIIKRRLAHIIEIWASCFPQFGLGDVGYKMIMTCFSEPDMVTRFQAALAIKSILDDFDEKNPKFYPYLEPAIIGIIRLANDMSGGTTTVFMLDLICNVIETLREAVRPFTNQLITNMTILWNNSAQKKMVLAGIVRIMNKMVVSLKGAALEMERSLIPVLSSSCDIDTSPSQVIDEGLSLWRNMIHQSPFLSDPMTQFFPRLEPLLVKHRSDGRIYVSVMDIITAYLLIGKIRFWKANMGAIVQNITHGLAHTHKNSIYCVSVELLRFIVMAFPKDSFDVIAPCLEHVWKVLLGDQTKAPKHPQDYNPILSSTLLFFELFLLDAPFFQGLIAKISGTEQSHIEHLNRFIGIVIEKIKPKDVKLLDNQRMIAMGLAILLTINSENIPKSVAMITRIVECCLKIEKREQSLHPKRKWHEDNPCVSGSPAFRNHNEVC